MRRTVARWLERCRAANWGAQHTPVMIAYGSKASKGTPMVARGAAGAGVRWGWGSVSCSTTAVSEVGVGVGTRPREGAPWRSPTSTSSNDLGQANNHPRTRYGSPASIHGVAQSCPFIRIANIATLAPYATGIIAPLRDRPRPRLHSNPQRPCGASPSAVGLCRPPRQLQDRGSQHRTTVRPLARRQRRATPSQRAATATTTTQQHYMKAPLQRRLLMVPRIPDSPRHSGCETGVPRI